MNNCTIISTATKTSTIIFSGENFPRGQFSWEQFTGERQFSGLHFPGSSFPEGIFPDTLMKKSITNCQDNISKNSDTELFHIMNYKV